jgi:hypothetical protein
MTFVGRYPPQPGLDLTCPIPSPFFLMAQAIVWAKLLPVYTPTFTNLVHSTHTYLPVKVEQTECSETSAFKIQTPGNYPKEIIQHSKHGESLKSRIHLIYLRSFMVITFQHVAPYTITDLLQLCKYLMYQCTVLLYSHFFPSIWWM